MLYGLTACALILNNGEDATLTDDSTPAVGSGQPPSTAPPKSKAMGDVGQSAQFRWTKAVVVDSHRVAWQRVAPQGKYSWAEAQAYCAALDLNGAGWRLPSKSQLLEMLSLDPSEMPIDAPTEWLWSETQSAHVHGAAWAVGIGNYTNSNTLDAHGSLRCVRSEVSPIR